ncbi:sulfate adenylyltransferase subunit CysN [Paeniglutamicibacter gangotriensis]|uniref:sulfate adenylyltransferase n=1 Tax=Paeniglutamicibacter gangotriensis Lz1y TaxID=1276920 RepID=M7MWD0_9MICC|nr:sulfate adenylyltransferase subunit CysN [Paeniglutamicibacter gangotriensis]EMQ99371.1 translation elongation factor Tu [Paeniglutamicibacter gangotriensis Lz1y]
MDLLRIATAGSVDDGKSTLIGRLLFDSKAIFVDQLDSVEKTSHERGSEYVDLALLTDGLRAEREQGITIDVAYRYFSTPNRKFIVADTPGHIQYTRNMVTGASTSDLSIVLVDARKGLVEQSRRHAFLVSLLEVPHLVIAVNKMDLVDWSQEVFEDIRREFTDYAARLNIADVQVIPVSALTGDNVVRRSENMPWYQGASLMHHLENVQTASDSNMVDVRFPVQYVIRPHNNGHHDYRGYAGQVASGVMKAGDKVVVLPSGIPSTIKEVSTADGPVELAYPPMSVTVRLEDDLDVSRGDMIVRPNNQPQVAQNIEAMICWMSDKPMKVGQKLGIKQTTKSTRALIKELRYGLNINTLHRDEDATNLTLNEIGRISIRTTQPLLADSYHKNRTTGGFILIDEVTNNTVAAGMIIEAS